MKHDVCFLLLFQDIYRAGWAFSLSDDGIISPEMFGDEAQSLFFCQNLFFRSLSNVSL